MTEEIKRVWAETAQRDKDLADVLAEHILDEDVVNRPKHYKGLHGLEVQEVIENFVPDSYSAHFKDAVKYLLRHLNKGNPKQDLEKCRYYVKKMIDDWDDSYE